MAVLAPQDWHPPRDHTMDASPSNPINPAVPRQRSSPANDPSASPAPAAQQQPYPYPVQQQQAGWNAPHSPQQYYPSFYQNHQQQQPYPMHGHPAHAPQGHMHPQAPYYDPANAQFAQWAYQQMMFNAHQAHQIPHVPSPMGTQRTRSGTGGTGDFHPGFTPFPSGTPPRHPSQLPNGGYAGSDHGQYQGFHPYRRPPQRQQSHNQDAHPPPGAEWAPTHQGAFQPPYGRSDAAGSSTSVNSTGSTAGGSRARTNSMQRAEPAPGPIPVSNHGHAKPSSSNGHGRAGSTTSSASSQAPSAPVPRPHPRTTSQSSTGSGSGSGARAAQAAAAAAAAQPPAALRRPSPLSQGASFSAAEKRMSRDDSDLAAMLDPNPNAPGVRSGGLKGRLRRALSMNATTTLREEDEEEDGPARAAAPGAGSAGDDTDSTATVQKKKSRSLFNSRLNRSTDNISLSSTMSSASVVIRKLGNIGKLARRNSLAGITSLFKDKDKKEKDGEGDGKKGKKKGEKGVAVEASVSHATAELDRSDWTVSPDLAGLSPAARLARQHTLKSNAEAAARAKAEQEARAAAAAAAAAQQQADAALPTTWEKNTTSRQANDPLKLAHAARVHEDGMRVIVEDDDSDSDDGRSDSEHRPQHYNADGWDDDEDWGEGQDEEDVTIRAGLEQTHLDDDEDMEPWATNVRRSVEKTRRPAKGILKKGPDGNEYQQDQYLQTPNPAFARLRSNSYDSVPSQHAELGPLARIPSPDPDHIDGLHKHNHGASNGSSSGNGNGSPGQVGFIPPLSFGGDSLTLDSPKDGADTGSPASHAPEKGGLFSHPNSSAPALSATFSPNPPTLSQRSATAPTKRLAFASNLSVYDTFPATVYDRRSEPATWSRLTPALAQRIKEELNSYKMEEMEVHAASRVHTQFFV
ncbi:hypothetical protein CERSUDRAFT_110067 [Gelatoporia subvermispora B]|uniref:Protein BNI4 n=1 Tax=Ceriporiopsis subvermispora (strain B) TaxID=914234 RepID=M2RSU6_CERS8|nr:hypothetical protein CERSUDRAFT_110067 [Gelatoporia subvermispora B]